MGSIRKLADVLHWPHVVPERVVVGKHKFVSHAVNKASVHIIKDTGRHWGVATFGRVVYDVERNKYLLMKHMSGTELMEGDTVEQLFQRYAAKLRVKGEEI